MSIPDVSKNISDFLNTPGKLSVFAYLVNGEIEFEEQLIIDDTMLYLGTYDQWMTENEVSEKLHFMVDKAKSL